MTNCSIRYLKRRQSVKIWQVVFVRSKTKNYLFSLEEEIKEKLSKAFKKTDYKILIVADENFKEENPKI